MATKHVAMSDNDYIVVGRRHGSESVRMEGGGALERAHRDEEKLTGWGYGAERMKGLAQLMADHGALLATRSEAVAAKTAALAGRDTAVNDGWRFCHQVEGALGTAALGDAELAGALNAALPAETSGLEAGILALGKILAAHQAKADPAFGAEAKAAEAEGLAAAVRAELDGAPVAKAAPVADTREIDLLDGKIVTWVARLNKTARRAFRDAGDDTKAREYRFHHLRRGGSAKGTGTGAAPTPTP